MKKDIELNPGPFPEYLFSGSENYFQNTNNFSIFDKIFHFHYK